MQQITHETRARLDRINKGSKRDAAQHRKENLRLLRTAHHGKTRRFGNEITPSHGMIPCRPYFNESRDQEDPILRREQKLPRPPKLRSRRLGWRNVRSLK